MERNGEQINLVRSGCQRFDQLVDYHGATTLDEWNMSAGDQDFHTGIFILS
jgi:hypothetical protein